MTTHQNTLTAPTLRIICTSLGLKVTDLEEIFDVAHRTATRWLSTDPAPGPVQAQVRGFQAATSALIEATLTEIDTELADDDTETTVILSRYPVDKLMPAQASDDQIWLHGPHTWDAMLGQRVDQPAEQGINAEVVTATEPQPLYRLQRAHD